MALLTKLAQSLWPTAGISLTWRKLLYRQLCKGDATPNFPFSKDFFGLSYEGNLNNSIEANILFYGAFEKPLLYFLRDTWLNLSADNAVGQKQAFVDIGANIGQHSLFMSNYADRVFAFEPFSAVSSKLKRHISLNTIDNIQLEETALSDQSEALEFYAPTGRNQGIGSFDASTATKGNVATSNLNLIRGDEFFSDQTQYSLDLIKIDVEGFEKKVIAGLQNTLRSQRPVVVCEIRYGQELSFSGLDDLLALLPEDYELRRFDTRNPDGSKAKKRGSKAKHSGFYRIVPFSGWRESGQDDVIAVPTEKKLLIPGFSAESE
ncbi:MAG: FkbM family methyltransferase [Pseudomonadales bacterium]|nr:FkbM family methyltransferase [Pseudomonadales bacterium]